MGNMAKRYGEAIRDELGIFAAWPIGTQLAVGDVGFLTRGGKLFERWGNIEHYNVKYTTKKASNLTDFDVTIGKGMQIQFKEAGKVPSPDCLLTTGDIGVTFRFSRKSSVVVRAHTMEKRIDNLNAFESDVIRLANNSSSKWRKDYVIVTTAYESVGTTVLLSSGRSSTVAITANAGVASPIDLANANIGLAAAAGCTSLVQVLARTKIVPFIQVHHLIGMSRSAPRLVRYGSKWGWLRRNNT